MARILIKNGKVVSPTGVHANDVLIDGETIAALAGPGYFTEEGVDQVIDAGAKFVIPGGIDVHTLAITDEVAPGVVASTQAAVVSGTVA